MNAFIATRPRRLGLAISVMLLAAVLSLVFMVRSNGVALQLSSTEELMKRLVVLPGLLAIASFVLTTALVSQRAQASSTVPAATPVAATGTTRSFTAQVVGVEWLNPLQRRDYPTEWQLLWTLGLVKPNKNDDMVKADATKFTTLQAVASIADASSGRETLNGYYQKYIDQLLVLFGDPYVMNAGSGVNWLACVWSWQYPADALIPKRQKSTCAIRS
jgi:hypothetical protein